MRAGNHQSMTYITEPTAYGDTQRNLSCYFSVAYMFQFQLCINHSTFAKSIKYYPGILDRIIQIE